MIAYIYICLRKATVEAKLLSQLDKNTNGTVLMTFINVP